MHASQALVDQRDQTLVLNLQITIFDGQIKIHNYGLSLGRTSVSLLTESLNFMPEQSCRVPINGVLHVCDS